MATIDQEPSSMFANKAEIRQLIAEINERMGYVLDLTATPEKVRAMMRADGITPNDNAFTSELLQMRYGDQRK